MNAQTSMQLVADSDLGTPTPEGYFISNEQLKKLGNGDIKAGRRLLRMMMADERDTKPKTGPTPKPDSVAIATPADEPEILALILQELSQSSPRWAPIDPQMVLQHIQRGTLQMGGIVGMIKVGGKIIAVTVLVPAQSSHSRAYFIQEVFNVVHPEHRRSAHAHDLMAFGCWCSDEWTKNFGYPVMFVHGLNSLRYIKEKIRFFRRYMTQVGATFIYPSIER